MDICPEELFHIKCEAPGNSPEFFKAFQDYATSSRQLYLDSASFLLSRSDLLLKLTNLSLINCWHPTRFEIERLVDGHMPTIQDPSFFDPTYIQNIRVLHQATHITYLKIMGFELSMEYLMSMNRLHSLHSLIFQQCSVHTSIIDAVQGDKYVPILTVVNLHLAMEREISWDRLRAHPMWYLLPFFINIKALAIDWFLEDHDAMPPPEVKERFNPFRNLERFAISRINTWEVPELVQWIRAVTTNTTKSLKLTHFKIGMRNPMFWGSFAALLEVLSHAPGLHTCVFDGLATNTVVLPVFEVISRYLPHILGITVIVYDDMEGRSHRSFPPWPGATWEYAKELAGFSRLQYFSWNYRFSPEYTPFWMPVMESGYPDIGLTMGRRMRSLELQEEDLLDDFESVAAVFAAYCPTLQTIAQVAERICLGGCHVQRQDGKVSFEPIEMGDLQATEKWNTDGLFGGGGWPPIVPGGNGQP
jgi:hypothetical protein